MSDNNIRYSLSDANETPKEYGGRFYGKDIGLETPKETSSVQDREEYSNSESDNFSMVRKNVVSKEAEKKYMICCNKCGAFIDDDSIFCKNCGNRIKIPFQEVCLSDESALSKKDNEFNIYGTEKCSLEKHTLSSKNNKINTHIESTKHRNTDASSHHSPNHILIGGIIVTMLFAVIACILIALSTNIATNQQTPSSGSTVYISDSDRKCYHNANCSRIRGTVKEISLNVAIGKGYTACSFCDPIKISAQASHPTEATKPTPVAEPLSGTILSGKKYYDESEITISAPNNSSCVVKLKSAAGVARMSFFVRAGETVTVGVPEEYLYVYFASGKTWYGKSILFGENTHYSMDDEIKNFKDYIWEYTLYPVSDGNFSQTPINPEDF